MKFLLLNQCFHPDVMATGQYLTDLAVELVEQGHEVTVLTSRRGYDNPNLRFKKREVWKGITIIRLFSLGLGKKAKWRRAIDFASFLTSCSVRLALLPRFDVVIALTSPPLISFLGALFVKVKGGQFFFWVMDLNPDEAIAAGWLREESWLAKILQFILEVGLQQARKIIVLDRFMKQRLADKGVPESKLIVIPPWSHDDAVKFDEDGRRAFRARHGLTDKYVVMYSGNHSPCHPLETLLQAARHLTDRPDIAFCFIGGGSEFDKVKAFVAKHGLTNTICLPYQPLGNLSASLSAADMHVVVMGDAFKGVIHPSKIYNVLAIGKPFLYVGPTDSHVMDIIRDLNGANTSFTAAHGETSVVVKHISDGVYTVSKSRANGEIAARFSRAAILPSMLKELEAGTAIPPVNIGRE